MCGYNDNCDYHDKLFRLSKNPLRRAFSTKGYLALGGAFGNGSGK